MNDDDDIKSIKIILVGMSGSGKTNMIYALTDQDFDSFSMTSTSSTFVEKFDTFFGTKYRLEIWDTAGQEKFRSLTKLFVKDSKIVIYVYDITSKESFEDLDFWIKTVSELLGQEPVYGICGNKSDLYQNEQVKEELGEQKAKDINASFKIVSAKTTAPVIKQFVKDLVIEYLKKSGDIEDTNKKKGKKLKIQNQNNEQKNGKKCC